MKQLYRDRFPGEALSITEGLDLTQEASLWGKRGSALQLIPEVSSLLLTCLQCYLPYHFFSLELFLCCFLTSS